MYGTIADLYERLEQVPVNVANNALLTDLLEAATGMCDAELTFSFADYGEYAEGTERDVWSGAGGEMLYLPAHQTNSLESVYRVTARGETGEGLTEVEDYVVETRWRLYRYRGWERRSWYRCTAVWGVGPAPVEVVNTALTVAINLWHGRSAGRLVGEAGIEGAIPFRAMGWAEKNVLAQVRQKYGRAL